MMFIPLDIEHVNVMVPDAKDFLGCGPLRILSVLPNILIQDFREEDVRTTYENSRTIRTDLRASLDGDDFMMHYTSMKIAVFKLTAVRTSNPTITLVDEISSFYGTRRFVTVLTGARHCTIF
jgi:hypothetical protein